MTRADRSAVGYCLGLVSGFPLHLLAAATAALLSEALLTIQPLFLRAFIDAARAGGDTARLWLFPAFMLAAAALAYSFDFIAASIRDLLETGLLRRLKEAYLDYGNDPRPETRQLCLRTGLADLARLTLSLTLDFGLALSRLVLITAFLCHEDPATGGAAAAALVAGVAVSTRLTRLLGKAARAVERATERLAATQARGPATARLLDRVERVERAQYRLRSLNFLVSFALFRLLPLAVVVRFALGSAGSLGALASVFLYFSMLRAPFTDMVAQIQGAHVSLSEIALFRVPLERGLATQRLLASVPAGLVWQRARDAFGRRLSAGLSPDAREYYDDMPAGTEKETRLAELARAARQRSAFLRGEDPAAARHAHFIWRPGLPLTTALAGARA